MAISYHTLSTAPLPKSRAKLNTWIKTVANSHHKKTGPIHFVFCTDEELLEKNIHFLNHKTLTDIITFDYSEQDKISGDIFISVPRVSENAVKFGVDAETEMRRVLIHGILHLCGFKDKTEAQEKKMRQMENKALRLWV